MAYPNRLHRLQRLGDPPWSGAQVRFGHSRTWRQASPPGFRHRITELTIDWLGKHQKNWPFLVMSRHKAPQRNWILPPERLTLYAGVRIWELPTLFDAYSHRASVVRTQQMKIARENSDDP